MATLRKEIPVANAATPVWHAIRDFGQVHTKVAPGFLTGLKMDNGDRIVTFFNGVVARTANSLDPASRTLLVEIQVPNPDGKLMPGTYAQVDLNLPRKDPPLLIPSDTLVVRPSGTLVALVDANNTVHFQNITVGRDLGERIEVLSGLKEGQRVIVNPNDSVQEGVKVHPVSGK